MFFLPNNEIAASSPCSAAKDSNKVVDRPWFEIQVGFPGYTNLTLRFLSPFAARK